MKIVVIGVNHHSAPIHIREKFSFSDTKRIEMLNQIANYNIAEVVILSTCNRNEVYIACEKVVESVQYIKKLIKEYCQVEDVKEYLFVKEGKEAVSHLYEVAAGLNSIVIGEDQILGQVKEAHEFAMAIGTSGKILNKCFREAITVAKKIKAETKISQYPLSISSIGVKFLKEKVGSLQGKNILMLGIGKMSQLALNHLMEEKVGTIYVANRTACKVEKLREQYTGIVAIPYEERYEFLKQVDILITATASPHLIIKSEQMPVLNKPLHILDMALPRDVEACIGRIEGIHLYNIDALQEISYQNSVKRNHLAHQSYHMIEEGVEAFYNWSKKVKVDPTIHSLHERCEVITEDTMGYLRCKLDLTTKEDKIIEKMLMSSLQRLVREPVAKLKEIQDLEKQDAYIKVIEELFDLKKGGCK